jgi:hypothetical protein
MGSVYSAVCVIAVGIRGRLNGLNWLSRLHRVILSSSPLCREVQHSRTGERYREEDVAGTELRCYTLSPFSHFLFICQCLEHLHLLKVDSVRGHSYFTCSRYSSNSISTSRLHISQILLLVLVFFHIPIFKFHTASCPLLGRPDINHLKIFPTPRLLPEDPKRPLLHRPFPRSLTK